MAWQGAARPAPTIQGARAAIGSITTNCRQSATQRATVALMAAIAKGFCQLGRQEYKDLQTLTDGEFRVYAAIALSRDSRTLKTPAISYALIADKCGKSKDSVRVIIDRLVAKGAITQERQGMWFVFGFPHCRQP